jgi:TonB family protein
MSSSVEVAKTWEGRTVEGKFPLRKWLGGSDHSTVFLTERDGGEKAAIKLIPAENFPEKSHSEETQLSLWAVSGTLSHAHLLRLFEFGRCRMDGERFLYVVMEYAEEDLSQILPARALAPEEVEQMLAPVVDALAFVHAAGFVHGRIKPSNVMAVDNQLKISADSLRETGEAGPRRDGRYDAPEAASALTAASDVWSIGALLVTVLTQREPDLLKRDGGELVVSDAIPEPYRGMARRCLRVNPQQRCSLADILNKPRVIEPVRVVVTPPREPEETGRQKGLWIGGGILVVIALVVAGWLAMHGSHQNPPSSSAPAATVETPAAETPVTQTPAAQNSASQNLPAQSPTTSAPTTSAPIIPTPAVVEKPATTATSRGSVLNRVTPPISRAAQHSIHGRLKVSVQVSVNAVGSVFATKLESAGPSQYFANQALEAARGWKFNPPMIGGQAANSEWLLRFQFSRSGTQVTPVETKP